jgi:hypothetical protein
MATPSRRYALLLATAPFSLTVVAPSGLTDVLQFSAGCHGLDCLLVADITVTAGACTISYSNSIFFLNDSPTAASISTFGTAPIGAIIAWHKTFAGTPALPVNWVECNGQVLVNPLSVYNGLTIPDMNSVNKYFIRGGLASGGVQTEGTKVNGLTVSNESAHTHDINHDHGSFNSGNENAHTHAVDHNHASFDSGGQSQTHTHSFLRNFTATFAAGVNKFGDVAVNAFSTGNNSRDHTHPVDVPAYVGASGAGDVHAHTVDVPALGVTASGAGAAHGHALTGDAETRPANITMVWIMRIY